MNGFETQISAQQAQWNQMVANQRNALGALSGSAGGISGLFGSIMQAQSQAAQNIYPYDQSKLSQTKKETKTVIAQMREYIKEYRNVIFTVAFVALADHFLFKGALRDRLKDLVENLLKKAEDKTNAA